MSEIGSLLKLLKPYKGKVALIIIGMIVSSVFILFIPMITRTMMDLGFMKNDYQIIRNCAFLIFIIVTIDILNSAFRQIYGMLIEFDLSQKLYEQAMEKLGKIKMSFFAENNSSSIINQVNCDVGKLSSIADESILGVFIQIFKAVGGLVGLFILDVKLTLLVLCYLPIKMAITFILSNKNKKLTFEYIREHNKTSSWFADTLDGMFDIRLLNVCSLKIDQYKSKIHYLLELSKHIGFLTVKNNSADSFLTQCLETALYILGAYFISAGKMSFGSLIAFITYTCFITNPLSLVVNLKYTFANILPSITRYNKFMESEEEPDIGTRILPKEVNAIELKNICFSYPNGKKILEDLSLKINRNEKVAIVGSNGSGKTTLLNILLRFEKPDFGKIFVNEKDINDYPLEAYRELFGYAGPKSHIFEANLNENIDLKMNIDKGRLEKSKVEFNLNSCSGLLGNNGAKISSGQMQKVLMLRVLLRNTQILLLDEAISNVDAETSHIINNMILKEIDDKIIIVVTHNPTILHLMDKVIFIHEGQVTGYSNHISLYQNNCEYRKFIASMGNE